MITLETITGWFDRLATVFEENKDTLTALDSAIGDADHGINVARGFAAVKAAMADKPPADIAAAFKTAAMSLIKTVGGASGPLYGTWFMKAGPLLPGTAVDLAAFAKAVRAGVDGVMKMGKSQAGEKTMLDAWLPAAVALEEAAAAGLSDKDALAKAAAAAEQGMKDTIPMLATKGRASYLGERSVGHQDPGATSTWLLVETLADAVQ